MSRENYLRSYIKKKELTLEDVFRIASHHGEEAPICRHGGSDTLTLSSMIFHLKNDLQPKILYTLGNPCENKYEEFKA